MIGIRQSKELIFHIDTIDSGILSYTPLYYPLVPLTFFNVISRVLNYSFARRLEPYGHGGPFIPYLNIH